MIKRNIYFIISLITYLFLAIFLTTHIKNDEILIKAFFIVAAIVLAFFNVTPRFKKNDSNENNDERISSISGIDYQGNYLILTNKSEIFQFFVFNSIFVFKRLKNDSDVITDIDNFKLSDLKKNDMSIPFSSIRDVTFNDNTELFESGELIFRYEKRATFCILDTVEQEVIDSYFKNVNYKKKSYRDKLDNSKRVYPDKKRRILADLSYLSKLMIPFSIVICLFFEKTEKEAFYYIFSAIGLAGFIIAAYMSVRHLLIIFPNPKGEKDDIDAIGDGVLINIFFIMPYITEIIFANFDNPVYSYLLVCLPTVIITLIFYFYDMPKTEIEKAYRVIAVAGAVAILIFSMNSFRYTDIKTEQGTVIEVYEKGSSDDVDTYSIMGANGEIFDIHFGSFEENDKVKIEYKKGLLGMKIIDVKIVK